jgi:hypothetical protein
MAGNGDRERLRQLERRASGMDELIRRHGEQCTVARLDLADRLGRIETALDDIRSELTSRAVSSARVTAAIITAGAGVITAVIALIV